jgi:signal transduction histidine kinase
MDALELVRDFRHAIANPLAGLLAEAQLLLLNEAELDGETVRGLRSIEQLALRMRAILRETYQKIPPAAESPSQEPQ